MHRWFLLPVFSLCFGTLPRTARAHDDAAVTQQPVTLSGTVRKLGVSLSATHFALANGLRVYVVEDHSVPVLAVNVTYDVGSRDEPPGRTGFAHFFEHMMFKGSENVPDGGYFKYVLGVGGDLNASTGDEETDYYQVLPSQYLDMALWLEADRLRSLVITDENFENQRNAVKEEKALNYDNVPYRGAIEQFMAEIWAGSGYGHETIGSEQDLSAATTEDVREFFARYYRPNNAVLSIVGDVDPAEVQRRVSHYFGDIPRGPDRAAFVVPDHTQARLERRYSDKFAQQPLYLMGWKTVPHNHPDRHALDVLVSILLDGASSRLARVLVDEKQVAVATFSLGSHRDAGMAMIGVIPNGDVSLPEVRTQIMTEVNAIQTGGIAAKILQKTINQITVATVESLATNLGRAELIGNGVVADHDPLAILTNLERYRAVTADDIKRVATTYMTDQWVTAEILPAQ